MRNSSIVSKGKAVNMQFFFLNWPFFFAAIVFKISINLIVTSLYLLRIIASNWSIWNVYTFDTASSLRFSFYYFIIIMHRQLLAFFGGANRSRDDISIQLEYLNLVQFRHCVSFEIYFLLLHHHRIWDLRTVLGTRYHGREWVSSTTAASISSNYQFGSHSSHFQIGWRCGISSSLNFKSIFKLTVSLWVFLCSDALYFQAPLTRSDGRESHRSFLKYPCHYEDWSIKNDQLIVLKLAET